MRPAFSPENAMARRFAGSWLARALLRSHYANESSLFLRSCNQSSCFLVNKDGVTSPKKLLK
jgi:hypothetical protein